MALSKPNYYVDLYNYHFTSKKGNLILGLIGLSVGGTVVKKLYDVYSKDKSKTINQNEIQNKKEKRDKLTIDDYINILKMSMGKNKRYMIIHFVIYTLILSTKIFLSVKLMNQIGILVGYLADRNFKKMIDNQLRFTLWCFPSAIMNSLMSYYEKFLAIKIRKNLTSAMLSNYFDKMNYYKIKCENVDQVVTEDINHFANDLTDVYSETLKPFIDIIYVTYLLTQKAGWRNIVNFYGYYFLVTTLLSYFRPNYSKFLTDLKLVEGDMRSKQTNIITYKEEIAFLNGNKRELDISTNKFNNIIKKEYNILNNKFITNYNDSLWLKYGGTMTAYCVLMPEIYSGNFKGASADIINYYTTCSNYMISLGGSIKDMMMVYKNMDKLSSSLIKIKNFNKSLNQIEYITPTIKGDTLIVKNLSITTPEGNKLIENLNMEIQKGKSVIITGKNGIGKSSFFRSLGGLWNFEGEIIMPENSYFIPQKSYFIKDNLYNTIAYPNVLPDDPVRASTNVDAKEIDELLRLFDLYYLKDRHRNNLVEWMSVLSGGEKQRLAFVRMLYKEPDFCILDEATSAISAEIEEKIFQILKQKKLTLVSIVHKESLVKYHDVKLTLYGGNNYELVGI